MARSMAGIPAPAGRAIKLDTHPDGSVRASLFLASSGSEFGTCRAIDIDGGMTAWRGSKNA